MKRIFLNLNKAALLIWSLIPLAAVAQPTVWTTSSMVRTGPSDPIGYGTNVNLYAGKGENESFQVVVRAPAYGLSNVNFSVSGLSGPGGAYIPSSAFTLFREQYVYVNKSSADWGGSNRPLGVGWYPDGLIPFTDPATGVPLHGANIQAVPFGLNGYQNQPLWVDLLVPRDAVAGTYYGSFTVTSDQGSVTGYITATVWHFTMPFQPTLHSAFLYWAANDTASDEELLRNRIAPLRSDPSRQSTLMNFGLSSVGIPFFSGADVSNCYMTPAPSISQFQAVAAAQQPGLMVMNYSSDEIGRCPSLFPQVQQWAYNMHQAGIRNFVPIAPTPALYDDGSGTGRSAVDIWAMLPVIYDLNVGASQYVLSKGDSIWSYNALTQDAYSPKWEIDFAPMNFRIQPGFINQSLGLSGLMYWRADYWSADPWNQVNNTGVFSTNNYPGEGMMVYPGWQVGIAGVAPSMRLKWIRDGADDYDYISLLKAAGMGSWALNLAATVGPNWTNWTRDPDFLANVRYQLGQQLDQIYGGSSAPAAPAAAPAPAAPVSTAPVSSGGSAAPTVTGLTPSNAGTSSTFVVGVADANGSSDLAGAGVLINSGVNGTGACWLYYNLANSTVSLADDTASGWSSVVQGSGSVISNSQCSIAGTGFGAYRSGNGATITVTVWFNSWFAGTKSIYVNARDNEGLSSGFQSMGKWQVP